MGLIIIQVPFECRGEVQDKVWLKVEIFPVNTLSIRVHIELWQNCNREANMAWITDAPRVVANNIYGMGIHKSVTSLRKEKNGKIFKEILT